MQKKMMVITAAVCLAALMLGGCSALTPVQSSDAKLVNGTTAGNIQNLGFAVKQDDDIYFYYTGGGTYEVGDIVKSNPETGDNSFVMHDGGFYMSLYDGSLYYCREDGIYRAPLDTLEPQLLLEGSAVQLQILDGQMYYLEDGAIKSAMADGSAADFSSIQGAECLSVYENKLFYIDSASGQFWQAEKDGSSPAMLFDVSAKQYMLLDSKLYYIDRSDEQIKRVTEEKKTPETVVPYVCRSLNVNEYGMFYTREVDGKWVCCSSDVDGGNEQTIKDSETAQRHMICMFGGGALIVGEEDFKTAAE